MKELNVPELVRPLVPFATVIREAVRSAVQEAEDRAPLIGADPDSTESLLKMAISALAREGMYRQIDRAAGQGLLGRVERVDRSGFLLRLLPGSGLALRFGRLNRHGGLCRPEDLAGPGQQVSALKRAFYQQAPLPLGTREEFLGVDIGYTRGRNWALDEVLISMVDAKGHPVWSLAIPSQEVLDSLGRGISEGMQDKSLQMIHRTFRVVVEPQKRFAV